MKKLHSKKIKGYCPNCFEYIESFSTFKAFGSQKSLLCGCGFWFGIKEWKSVLLKELTIIHKIKRFYKRNL